MIRFSKHEFSVAKAILNFKYYLLESQKDNLFYLLKNHVDYAITHYFTNFETTKHNLNRFLLNLLMTLLIKKLSYQNVDKLIEKLSEIL